MIRLHVADVARHPHVDHAEAARHHTLEREDVLFPVHLLHLRDMGLTQGQNFDLEALSADCDGDGVYEFLLEASPLPFTGAVGSPVNPVAIK